MDSKILAMKKTIRFAAALLCGAMLLQGCSTLLSSVLGTDAESSSAAAGETLENILGSILGTFGQSTSKTTIIGTWTYSKPAVQFESESLLAKAGGTVASAKIVQELEPYYKKIGISEGKMSITLKEDLTCSYTIKGKTYNGTYTFDEATNKLQISGSLLSMPAAYVSVAGSQLSLTFDTTKLLAFAGAIGSVTGSGSTLASIAQIAQNYDGMKAGFLFTK